MLRQIVLMLIFTASLLFGQGVPLLAQQTSPPDSAQQIIVRVDGASCPFCAFGLEKRLGHLEGVADVRLEMKAGKVIITLQKGATVSEQALRQAVEEAGFTPREISFLPSG
ncbi:heavy-metal-associated domain-containing protein [Nitrospiraceae bacterium AH_259_D15_M11_P09]|nr:heavy-metal-associated domain-containing protein [Nitrospiraceae bacterium AH_259_D15_M11_P09]